VTIPLPIAWGLAALCLVVAARGVIVALRAEARDRREGPRPGMIELGIGLGGLALLLPTLAGVYWP
jgi:hypothetical protein